MKMLSRKQAGVAEFTIDDHAGGQLDEAGGTIPPFSHRVSTHLRRLNHLCATPTPCAAADAGSDHLAVATAWPRIKDELIRQDRYGRDVHGIDVYRAVLDRGARTPHDFDRAHIS